MTVKVWTWWGCDWMARNRSVVDLSSVGLILVTPLVFTPDWSLMVATPHSVNA
jgi:hypothetical protein